MRRYLRALAALALLAMTATAHAAYGGGGNDVLLDDPFWLYLLAWVQFWM